MTWDEAVAFALTLPGTAMSTSYGKPAVKVKDRAVLNLGHEPETSFVLRLDPATIEMLLTTHPETFWQTPHYAGYAAVLVRYDAPDDQHVREMIERAVEQATFGKVRR